MSQQIEALDLDEIERRASAATLGPWMVDRGFLVLGTSGNMSSFRVGTPDAEFMAHARTDIPALIAEVKKLRAERPVPPNGWKLVPVEPTDEMLRYGNGAWLASPNVLAADDCWTAMLATAPAPPKEVMPNKTPETIEDSGPDNAVAPVDGAGAATASGDDWAETEALQISTDSGLDYDGSLIYAIASALRAARARGLADASQVLEHVARSQSEPRKDDTLALAKMLRSLAPQKRRTGSEP